jgi:putative chitinase
MLVNIDPAGLLFDYPIPMILIYPQQVKEKLKNLYLYNSKKGGSTVKIKKSSIVIVGLLVLVISGGKYLYWAHVDNRFLTISEGKLYQSAAMPMDKIKEKVKEKEKPTEPPKPTVPTGKRKAPEKPVTKEAPKAPTKAPEVKPKVEKAPEVTAPKPKVTPTPAKPPAAKAPSKVTQAPKISKLPKGAGPVISALVAAGLSSKAQANIRSQVQAESNFIPRSENLNYSTPEAIQKTFGKNRIPSLEFAKTLVNNPEALANHVYAKTDGNSEPGDGWKYRGRGFLQHTGKNQYESIKKYTGIDVVTNPDLLNDPVVAAKAIPWFFLNYKKKKPEQLENISEVNKAVGFADTDGSKALKRAEMAEQFQSQDLQALSNVNVGSQIDSVSKENKDLKNTENDKSAPTVINNTTNTQQNSTNKLKMQKEDDRSAYQKKAQG